MISEVTCVVSYGETSLVGYKHVLVQPQSFTRGYHLVASSNVGTITNNHLDSFLASEVVINAFAVRDAPVNINLSSLFVRSINSVVK